MAYSHIAGTLLMICMVNDRSILKAVLYLLALQQVRDLHLHVLEAAAPADFPRAALEMHYGPCTQLSDTSGCRPQSVK